MPPIFESKGGITSLKSNQGEFNDHEEEKGGGASSSLLKDANSTTGSYQIHKGAYDDSEIKCVKCKKPLNDNNEQEDQENVDHSIIGTSSSDSEKCNPEGVQIKESHAYIDKLEEQKQSEVLSFNDEIIADGQSDVKATAKMDIPPELLESANLNDPGEAVQGITKFSGDSEDACKEDDSDNKNDKDGGDRDDPPERIGQAATSEQQPTETQSIYYGRQDSNVPFGEADECSSPVGKAKFVIGVKSITKISQFKGPVNSTYLPENSTNSSPNNLPMEEQTQHKNNSSELIVNKLEMGTNNSISGATTLLTVESVEKLQSSPLYAYFLAPAGPGATGDSPMDFSHENLKPRDENENDDDNDDDVIALEESVSDNESFKSGPADAFDPYI